MIRVLVCIDLDDSHGALVDAVRCLAAEAPVSVLLIHVATGTPNYAAHLGVPDFATDPTGMTTSGIIPDPQSIRDAEAAALRLEHRRLSEIADLFRGVVVAESILVQGDPVEKIIEHQARIDPTLTMLASRGHGAMHDLVVGSVSRDLIRRSRHPLVLVPLHNSATGG